jgi:methyl-accepting chemotaxis protein
VDKNKKMKNKREVENFSQFRNDLPFYEIACEKIYKNFQTRLRLDAIDPYTQRQVENFFPTVELAMPEIIGSFYAHMTQFEETKKYFKNVDVQYLKSKQINHWKKLLSGELNKEYVYSSARVGFIHHRVGLPLFLYLSGYNRVLCDLTALAIRHHMGTLAATETVSAMIKMVSLDMDISISCYFVADHLDEAKNQI